MLHSNRKSIKVFYRDEKKDSLKIIHKSKMDLGLA